jgi:hypothetical protein
VTPAEMAPPLLPGEVWRGESKDGETVAVCLRDGQAWTYIWGPPEFGPFEWWGSTNERRDDTLSAWALVERARAERAEAELARLRPPARCGFRIPPGYDCARSPGHNGPHESGSGLHMRPNDGEKP